MPERDSVVSVAPAQHTNACLDALYGRFAEDGTWMPPTATIENDWAGHKAIHDRWETCGHDVLRDDQSCLDCGCPPPQATASEVQEAAQAKREGGTS